MQTKQETTELLEETKVSNKSDASKEGGYITRSAVAAPAAANDDWQVPAAGSSFLHGACICLFIPLIYLSFFITDPDTGHGVRLSLQIPWILVTHVTPVNNVAICLEVLPWTALVCAAAAENVQAAFAGLVAAETAAERERAAMIQ